MILTRYRDTHRRFHFDSEIRLPVLVDSPRRHAPRVAIAHLLAFARHGHPRARPGTAGGFRRRNEARSVAQKALLRTISSHGTGPSRHERPTLAFKSEDGGAVHDGPLAKDAGPLPGGRECCATAAAQANVTSSSAVGSAGGMGSARAATRQAPDTGSSMWGLAREQLRSLGCCVVIIYHGHWTPAHGLSPCEWTTARSAHRSGISACAWVPQPPFAAVSGGRECVRSRVHRAAVWQFGALSDSRTHAPPA